MRKFAWAVFIVMLGGAARAADPYVVKTVKVAPPKEFKEAVTKLLSEQAIQFHNDKDELLAEVWLRKEVPAKATAEQIKNGLTWQEVEQTTLLGAVRIVKQAGDYRKQKLKPGLYTMRLGLQPQDGDHMGTAPYGEFALLVPAERDEGKATLEPEQLHKMSTKASGSGHPAVLLMFPVPAKDLGTEAKLLKRDNSHWGISFPLGFDADGKKAKMGVGLTLVGTSPSA